jgi:hypothetical protein
MSTPTIPLFGRSYNLQLLIPNSSGGSDLLTITDSTWEPEALRITFDVQTSWWSTPWYADISIYNLGEAATNQILGAGTQQQSGVNSISGSGTKVQQNMEVILSAGYQGANTYAAIWDGYVLQPTWERENQTDFKLTLHCMNWLGAVSSNWINKNWGPLVQQQQIIADIAAKAFNSIGTAANNTQTLTNKTLPRGKTEFGNPGKPLMEIMRDNNLQWWLGQKGLLNFTGLSGTAAQQTPIDSSNPLVCTPGNTSTVGDCVIIGTPRQTQLGVDVRLLLDSRVQVKIPCMSIKIDNSSIQQLLYQVGTNPGLLNQTGTYAVIGAHYHGDTRGNNWYVDVTGWYLASAQLAALAAGADVQLNNGYVGPPKSSTGAQ